MYNRDKELRELFLRSRISPMSVINLLCNNDDVRHYLAREAILYPGWTENALNILRYRIRVQDNVDLINVQFDRLTQYALPLNISVDGLLSIILTGGRRVDNLEHVEHIWMERNQQLQKLKTMEAMADVHS